MFAAPRNRLFWVMPAAVLAASCASGPEPAPAPRTVQHGTRPAVPARPSMSAADYVSRSGNIDLFVIEASEVARARSSTRKIQEVADRLTALHKRTSGELSLAGRRLNLLPSATLDPVHQAMLERLRTAPDFDRAYADAMKSVHSYAYAMNTSYAARGSSPTLRAVAAAMVPEMQSALRLLTYI